MKKAEKASKESFLQKLSGKFSTLNKYFKR